MSNVIELNAGKSAIGFEEALFIQAVKTRAVGGMITMQKAVEAFWEAAGSLRSEIAIDGEGAIQQVEEDIRANYIPTFAHLFRRAGVELLTKML